MTLHLFCHWAMHHIQDAGTRPVLQQPQATCMVSVPYLWVGQWSPAAERCSKLQITLQA